MAKVMLTNFSKGEFAPALFGRVDVPQYNAGAKQVRNWVIQRYGGLVFRPGFRFVGEVDDVEGEYRLLPFQFSNDQAYVHVLGDFSLRVAANGGFLVETDDLKIVGATKASSMVLNIPFHDLAVGDRGFIDGITGMTELNGKFVTVTAVPDADHVTVNVNSTAFGTLTASTGITRTAAPAPPVDPAPPVTPLPEPTPPEDPPPATGGGGTGGSIGGGAGGYGIRTPRQVSL